MDNNETEFWLIDKNFVGVVRFHKNKKSKDQFFEYMFIDEGIVMGIHGEKPPLMKNRKEMKIEDARLYWNKLRNEGWKITTAKWQ